MNIETKTYSDGTTATGLAPLPMQSPTVPTEAQLLGMVEDYGQWLWDCGYFDEPTGETLVDEAAFKRQEIKAALNAALIEAYAEGRKDEAEENEAGRLIDAWAAAHGKPVPWAKAVEIVAIVKKLPDAERSRLLALGEAQ